ncbi:hypothetical protein [Empedobacter brevis]|uniref:hypothetical protein n=1 Tax=Empedobacter brevis TaxID=247 RepID=UPI00289C6C1E|nr:hypothetical protein [Empedobacter brevis]
MRILFLIMVFVLSTTSCKSQKRIKKDIPESYKKEYIKHKVPSDLVKKAVDVTKYLPKNYVKDGTVDYTKYIQKALDENKIVRFSKMSYLTTGISINSNSKIIFEEGALLKMKTNDLERYAIISLVGIENVELYNPRVDGDLERRKSFKGEWGFGIDIRGSRNIKIFSPYVTNCFGDGIVISKSKKGTQNKQLVNTSNIHIENAFINYSGRNGISIISVDGLTLESPIIINTFTKLPQSAIDIEPDTSSDILNNILINSPFTYNNTDGILIHLKNFVGKNTKTSNITINNHTDLESSFPLNISDLKEDKSLKQLSGNIIVNNPVWIGNRNSFVRGKSFGLSQKIEINNPVIKDLKLNNWKGKDVKKMNTKQKILLQVKDETNFIVK